MQVCDTGYSIDSFIQYTPVKRKPIMGIGLIVVSVVQFHPVKTVAQLGRAYKKVADFLSQAVRIRKTSKCAGKSPHPHHCRMYSFRNRHQPGRKDVRGIGEGNLFCCLKCAKL